MAQSCHRAAYTAGSVRVILDNFLVRLEQLIRYRHVRFEGHTREDRVTLITGPSCRSCRSPDESRVETAGERVRRAGRWERGRRYTGERRSGGRMTRNPWSSLFRSIIRTMQQLRGLVSPGHRPARRAARSRAPRVTRPPKRRVSPGQHFDSGLAFGEAAVTPDGICPGITPPCRWCVPPGDAAAIGRAC